MKISDKVDKLFAYSTEANSPSKSPNRRHYHLHTHSSNHDSKQKRSNNDPNIYQSIIKQHNNINYNGQENAIYPTDLRSSLPNKTIHKKDKNHLNVDYSNHHHVRSNKKEKTITPTKQFDSEHKNQRSPKKLFSLYQTPKNKEMPNINEELNFSNTHSIQEKEEERQVEDDYNELKGMKRKERNRKRKMTDHKKTNRNSMNSCFSGNNNSTRRQSENFSVPTTHNNNHHLQQQQYQQRYENKEKETGPSKPLSNKFNLLSIESIKEISALSSWIISKSEKDLKKRMSLVILNQFAYKPQQINILNSKTKKSFNSHMNQKDDNEHNKEENQHSNKDKDNDEMIIHEVEHSGDNEHFKENNQSKSKIEENNKSIKNIHPKESNNMISSNLKTYNCTNYLIGAEKCSVTKKKKIGFLCCCLPISSQ